jgi:hypothetical protein
LHGVGATELKMGKSADGFVERNSAMVELSVPRTRFYDSFGRPCSQSSSALAPDISSALSPRVVSF